MQWSSLEPSGIFGVDGAWAGGQGISGAEDRRGVATTRIESTSPGNVLKRKRRTVSAGARAAATSAA